MNKIYELFTIEDLMRRAEILIKGGLNDFAKSKAWNDLVEGDEDISLLAYTALQGEARRPGTVPLELLESLSGKISSDRLSSNCIPNLWGDSVEYIEEVEALLDQDTDLAQLVAYSYVRKLTTKPKVTPANIEETCRQIAEGIETFKQLIDGGENHENVQTVA